MVNVKEEAKKVFEYVVEKRRHFHEYPEVSMKEYETSKYIKKELERYNFEIIDASETGFFAIFDTGKKGQTIGLRTDIDALPILESKTNLKKEKVCVSKIDGVAHMCGHDGHMAMLLGIIKACYENKEQLSGKLVFIFEPAEETGEGIDSIIEKLKETIEIDAIFGMHLMSYYERGTIVLKDGALMAGVSQVDFDIIGQAGHGSRPDLAKSPIFAGANIVNQLASCFVNQIDVTKMVTLGLGEFNSGTADNIIPEKANITGTLRYFDVEEGKKARDILENVVKNICNITKCTYKFNKLYEDCTPVINDENIGKKLREIMSEYDYKISTTDTLCGSESFTKYSKLAPSFFALIGCSYEEEGIYADQHNEKFEIYEESLLDGVILGLEFVKNFM